ncbi:MAG: hypothetical protein ACLU3N_12615 [Lachnospiraceae bacterium]
MEKAQRNRRRRWLSVRDRQAELLISNYAEAAYNEELTVRPYETKVYYYIIRSNG